MVNHRNKIIIGALAVLLLSAGGWYFFGRKEIPKNSAVLKNVENIATQHEISGIGFEAKGGLSSPDYSAVSLNISISSPEDVSSTEFYEVPEQGVPVLKGVIMGGAVYQNSPIDGNGILEELGQKVGMAVKSIIVNKSGLRLLFKDKSKNQIGQYNFSGENLAFLDPFKIELRLNPSPEFWTPTSLAVEIFGASAISCGIYNAGDNKKIAEFPNREAFRGISMKIDNNVLSHIVSSGIYSVCVYADASTRQSNIVSYSIKK